ncbi:ANTAR domain-containing protein [Phaeacidiphilus oryzae]|uniref:ANTAR domain-containing protein n=1 Tax=Phaeacidiphilus oryzae TaxID=348818 RepID=UPI00068A1E31|nr:ANTAR domain-containing protein [Phaeacidiphilus oryzae]
MAYADRADGPGRSRAPASGRAALLTALDLAARAGRSLEDAVPAGTAELFGVAALTVDGTTREGRLELVWSDPPRGLGTELNELQFALGDGPGAEVQRSGVRVEEPDVATAAPGRWPVFLPAAARTRLRALTALPLSVGAATIGVLTAYRTTAGGLSPARMRGLERLAAALVPLLLNIPAAGEDHGRHPPGLHHAAIHQATGFLAERLRITTDQALLRLRAYAVAHDKPLTDLAREVLTDRLPASTWN